MDEKAAEKIGSGISWAGFWIGVGLLGADFVKWFMS